MKRLFALFVMVALVVLSQSEAQTIAGDMTVQKRLLLTGDISPAQLTGNVNDYDPTSLANASTLRLSSDASRNITGLAGGSDGRQLTLHNVGSFDIVLADESASSTAANRFALGGSNFTLASGKGTTIIYDATSSRWRQTGGGGSSAWGGITGTLSAQTDLQSALDAKLVKASNLSDITSASTARTNLGLAIGTNVQAYDADLTTYAGITPSANVQSLLAAADYAAMKTLFGLNNVENTALSTWAGSTSLTTLGTIGTGTWNATAIADGKIASALTGKTYNGLTLTAQAIGFTIAGGTTSKTLTVPLDASVSGTNTGDQDLSGYLTTASAASTYYPIAGGLLTGNLERAASVGADGLTLSATGIARTGTTADLDLALSAKGSGTLFLNSTALIQATGPVLEIYNATGNAGLYATADSAGMQASVSMYGDLYSTVAFDTTGGASGIIRLTDSSGTPASETLPNALSWASYGSAGSLFYNAANAPFYFAGNGPADPTTDFWAKLEERVFTLLAVSDTSDVSLYVRNTSVASGNGGSGITLEQNDNYIALYSFGSTSSGGERADFQWGSGNLIFQNASYFSVGGADLHLTGNLYFGASSGLTRIGNHVVTLTSTGTTNVTLPTSGTLATTTQLAGYQPLDAALTALASGSDFVVFSGPATSNKTFTLPNASATILTTNAAVTVAQGGTGATGAAGARSALLPSYTANAGKVLAVNGGATDVEWIAAVGVGTVTSVGLALPSIFSVSGSPVVSAGTLTGTLVNQVEKTFFAGPTSGADAAPTFRTIATADVPTLNQNTTGSAASLSVSGQTGLVTLTGLASTNRIKTVRDAADTILELGGSYTPTGTWTNMTLANPALGTPASGTLTNATGLPVAGIAASTSTAIGVGSVELGHASDTTLARSAAGVVQVEGKTLLVATATSGVGATPSASQTDTVSHGLGRAPVVIRIYGMSSFTNNNSAVPTTSSIGTYTSSGNRAIFQPFDATTITAAEPAATSTAFSIRVDTGVGNFVTGVIQNVTATDFDIVWTETGTATAQVYLWEAQ